MLDVQFVPQQYLIMCCVLRYLASIKECPLLHPIELDCFLATAVSPFLSDSQV